MDDRKVFELKRLELAYKKQLLFSENTRIRMYPIEDIYAALTKIIDEKETITDNSKTRKKREELSVSATKSIKKEEVEIVVQFH